MTKPRSWILCSALVLTAAAAGCGGSGSSQPPLPLSEGNATSVAAEALITSAQSSFTVQLPTGVITSTQAVLRRLAPVAAQRLTAAAAGPQNADGTMTGACAVSGSQTVTTAGTTVTFAFHDCVQDTGTRLDGSIKFTAQGATAGSTQISLSSTFDYTATTGTLSFAESGGYDIAIRTAQPTDNTEFELTGDRFSVALSVGGKLRDQVALSDFDIDVSQQLSSTGQSVEHFMYEVDSSWLKGHIGVKTTQDLKQRVGLFTPPAQYPFTGQIVISGANHTQLRITILGDETFTPPAGQGQIELEVDPGTGAFGAPTWTSWAALSTMVMN